MTCKPKEFRRFKPKPKKSRVLWRSGRIIKKGKDYTELRIQAHQRSGGYCEVCGICTGITWGELHHLLKRSHCGSDLLENVQWLCRNCHRKAHS